MWEIKDFSGRKSGYLQLKRDNIPVCDFFPFAAGADPAWVRAQAFYICDILNGPIAEKPSN